jgi:drug/metabolite transporter (DMT)-like permease
MRQYLMLGFFMAVVGFLENTAIAVETPIAVTVLCIYTQPVWTMILGMLYLKERVGNLHIFAVFMAVFGIFLTTKIWNISSFNYVGISISLIAGFLLSVVFIMIKKISFTLKNFLVSIFWFSFFETFFILFFGLISRLITENKIITGFTVVLPFRVWILILLFAFIPLVLGMVLFYTSVSHVPIVSVGVILLMEPISGILYGRLILGEPIDGFVIIGGVLILIASILVTKH